MQVQTVDICSRGMCGAHARARGTFKNDGQMEGCVGRLGTDVYVTSFERCIKISYCLGLATEASARATSHTGDESGKMMAGNEGGQDCIVYQ